jgi:lysosomal acid lipase/cholesteryl ester hydrolase
MHRYLRKTPCFTRSVFKTITFLLNKPKRVDPKEKIRQSATARGYELESWQVKTEDGYHLTVHRIIKDRPKNSGKYPVVFLQHGLMCSSADWLIPGGLAYFLADLEFDVWMGNFRGNTFSQGHEVFDYQGPDYWQFCWDQHASLDLPAMINSVLKATNQSQLRFIGHSMGTTALFAMLSKLPEMNSKIIKAIALAPVTHIENMSGLPKYCLTQANLVIKLVNM